MSSSEDDYTDNEEKKPIALTEDQEDDDEQIKKDWTDLGLVDVLLEAIEKVGWKKPTKMQLKAIPFAIEGKDVIGLAETGSGKTAAFVLPILQKLLDAPVRLSALVLTPTRELAYQIADQFDALGSSIGVKTAVIVGGIDMTTQQMALGKKPHIIIATPGRLVDHLENTKGFHLRSLRFLILDEADRILNMDFEAELDKILKNIPRDRQTCLFSATMTKKVAKLQRASLKNPVRLDVNSKNTTVSELKQFYLFIPCKYKLCYIVHLLREMAGRSFILFVGTCNSAQLLALTLKRLGMEAVALHGQMSQVRRLHALTKFRARQRHILIATDVASRGLDIPHVDVVLNVDVPQHTKDYIHRVGRTARAGRAGVAVTIVTQYDVELYQKVEHFLGQQLPLFANQATNKQLDENVVTQIFDVAQEAQRLAKQDLRELNIKQKSGNGKKKRDEANSDSEEQSGKYRKKLKRKKANITAKPMGFKNMRR